MRTKWVALRTQKLRTAPHVLRAYSLAGLIVGPTTVPDVRYWDRRHTFLPYWRLLSNGASNRSFQKKLKHGKHKETNQISFKLNLALNSNKKLLISRVPIALFFMRVDDDHRRTRRGGSKRWRWQRQRRYGNLDSGMYVGPLRHTILLQGQPAPIAWLPLVQLGGVRYCVGIVGANGDAVVT